MQAIFPNRETGPLRWGHVLDRFVIHVFSAGGVSLLVLWLAARFVPPELLPGWTFYGVPLGVAFTCISFREIWDVRNGNPMTKSVCDFVSWIAGFGLSAWLLREIAARAAQ